MTMGTTGFRASTWPDWLQTAIADIEQRVNDLSLNSTFPQSPEQDTFAERAENYYQKRPQLIALLQDLHNRYLYLADRYSQALKSRHRSQHSISSSDGSELTHLTLESAISDAESSLSFQPTPDTNDVDLLISELVMTTVEKNMLLNDLEEAERFQKESSRKIELQSSLLELLESERQVLLGENARLGFRASAAEDDARAMAAGAAYMHRKAIELERIVVKLRDDHRVCMLGRKVEGLQTQIYGLERRNKECYDAMMQRETEKGEAREELEQLRAENRRLREAAGRKREKVARWWEKVRRVEWVPCGAHVEVRKGCFQ